MKTNPWTDVYARLLTRVDPEAEFSFAEAAELFAPALCGAASVSNVSRGGNIPSRYGERDGRQLKLVRGADLVAYARRKMLAGDVVWPPPAAA